MKLPRPSFPHDADTRDALIAARDAIAKDAPFSLLDKLLRAVPDGALQRDLALFKRRRHDGGDGPWFEARGVWDLSARDVPPGLAFVRSLDLWRCHEIDAPTARWISELDALRDLRRLRVDECDLAAEALVAFGANGAFPRLHMFSMYGNFGPSRPLTGETLARLFHPRWGRGLRTLRMSYNEPDADACEALACAASLHRVRELDFRQMKLGAPAMRALLRRGAWPALTSLTLRDDECADASLPLLFASPVVERLTHLTLPETRMTLATLRALLDALPRMKSLTSLDLSDNPLGDEGAALIARASVAPTLRGLSLHGCQITAQGFEELLASPWAAQLAMKSA